MFPECFLGTISHPLREEIPIISGWSKTRYSNINEWQIEENRQLSEQRG